MSPILRRDPFAGEHGRARELAARRLDEALDAAEQAWLEQHLATCDECRAVAADYDEQRGLLRALRDIQPVPPRDLWARTAAAIEGGDARGRGRSGTPWRLGRLPLAPVAGLLVIAIAVGAGLLNGVGLFPSPSASDGAGTTLGATPIPLTAGEVQVLSRSVDGTLELSTRQIDAVCPIGVEACGSTGTTANTPLSVLGDLGAFDAYLSPAHDRIVVVQRGSDASGVYVVPVRDTSSPTPRPTTPPATPPAGDSPAPASPTATPEPTGSPDGSPPASPTASPDETATPEPSGSPAATATPSTSGEPPETPSVSPPPSPTATPEPTTSPSPTATPKPSRSPAGSSPSPSVTVTPSTDGALEIAHDVILVGSVSGYSADGARFAFTARPAGGSAGPDVYVWRTTDTLARPVTTDHASLFAGWLGDRLLISRVVDGSSVNVALDPETDRETPVGSKRMWRPAVSPDERTAAWWEGKVALAPDGNTWILADGRLVFGSWPDGDGRRQVLSRDRLADWHVRWDESGAVVAVWVSEDGPGTAGRLSLYLVDPATGALDVAKPLVADTPAFEGVSLRSGRLAWTAPAEDGGTTVKVFAWSGATQGQLDLPTSNGVTVLR